MALKIGTIQADITADTTGLDQAERDVKTSTSKMGSHFAGLQKNLQAANLEQKASMAKLRAAYAPLVTSMGAVEKQAKRTRFSLKGLTSGFTPMKGAARQAAFQIQDFAVQVGNGTNAMTSFSQQAPQLLSVFGPGGAIIGAVVGVATAIGASLLPALFSGKDAMGQLEDATAELDEILKEAATGGVVSLTDKIVELAKESEDAAKIEIKAGMITALEAMDLAAKGAGESLSDIFTPATLGGVKALVGEVGVVGEKFGIGFENAQKLADAVQLFARNDSVDNLTNLQTVVDEIGTTSGDASDEFIQFASDLRDFSGPAGTAADRLAMLKKIEQDLPGAIAAATATLDRQEVSVKKLHKTSELMRMARKRQAEEQAAENIEEKVEGLDDKELEKIAKENEKLREEVLRQTQLTADRKAELVEQINANELAQVQEYNAKLVEEDQKAHDKRQKAEQDAADRLATLRAAQQSAALAGLSALGDNINSVLEATGKESTAAAKAVFLAMKAIQVAQIIASTEVGAAAAGAHGAAIGGLPGWLASATGVRAMGYSSAALVAGLAVGETFGGGRQFGGTVSPQMAHPINEAGVPEILNTAGRQFLLPTGKGGTVSPLSSSSDGGGQPNVTIISNGTPQVVDGVNVSRDEVAVMINDAGRNTERRINGSLATGRGDTADSLRRGFKSQRNLR